MPRIHSKYIIQDFQYYINTNFYCDGFELTVHPFNKVTIENTQYVNIYFIYNEIKDKLKDDQVKLSEITNMFNKTKLFRDSNKQLLAKYNELKQCNNNDFQFTKNQFIYIASRTDLSNEGNYKYGGVYKASALKKRLVTYNSGNPKENLMKFAYIKRVHDFQFIEFMIKCVLDNKENKEMSKIKYISLKNIIDEVASLEDKLHNQMIKQRLYHNYTIRLKK